MDSIRANSISTFGGNPLVMAGALANLDYMLEHDLQTNAHKVGNHLAPRIDPLVGDPHRGRGAGQGSHDRRRVGSSWWSRIPTRKRGGGDGGNQTTRSIDREGWPPRQRPPYRPASVPHRTGSRRGSRDTKKRWRRRPWNEARARGFAVSPGARATQSPPEEPALGRTPCM